MSRIVATTALTTLFAVSLLAAAPHAASAQEAIMLEQIGAVRMAQPSEFQRNDSDLGLHASPGRPALQPDRHADTK